MGDNAKLLVNLENSLLHNLVNSEGDILEDSKLILTPEDSGAGNPATQLAESSVAAAAAAPAPQSGASRPAAGPRPARLRGRVRPRQGRCPHHPAAFA